MSRSNGRRRSVTISLGSWRRKLIRSRSERRLMSGTPTIFGASALLGWWSRAPLKSRLSQSIMRDGICGTMNFCLYQAQGWRDLVFILTGMIFLNTKWKLLGRITPLPQISGAKEVRCRHLLSIEFHRATGEVKSHIWTLKVLEETKGFQPKRSQTCQKKREEDTRTRLLVTTSTTVSKTSLTNTKMSITITGTVSSLGSRVAQCFWPLIRFRCLLNKTSMLMTLKMSRIMKMKIWQLTMKLLKRLSRSKIFNSFNKMWFIQCSWEMRWVYLMLLDKGAHISFSIFWPDTMDPLPLPTIINRWL